MTTLTIWLVTLGALAVLFGLTALAFRGGRQGPRSKDPAEGQESLGGDQTWLTTRNRFNETGG